MADDKKEKKEGEEEEGDEKKEEEEGFCDKLGGWIVELCKFLYLIISSIIKSIVWCLGMICFPIKEYCFGCCNKVDEFFNPYKQDNVHHI